MSKTPVQQPPPHAVCGLSSIPADILDTQILPRLDAPTLIAATSASSLFTTTHHHHLWSTICHSTWPSTATDHITAIISTFFDNRTRPGYQYFFFQSFPLPTPDPTTLPPPPPPPMSPLSPPELISAVDIHYRNIPIFSKTETTETVCNWFQCSPFRIDLINPKNIVTTPVTTPATNPATTPANDAKCTDLFSNMTLSWIIIDPINKKSVNLSSNIPVLITRKWVSGEVELRYGSVLAGDNLTAVECQIVVVYGGSEDGKLQLREVVMELLDMDGKCLNGRDSLGILHRVLEGKRGNYFNREEEIRKRYKMYEEMKRESRERREKKSRVKGVFDILSLVFGLCVSVGFLCILIFKKFILKKY